jgi:hypothetical protein
VVSSVIVFTAKGIGNVFGFVSTLCLGKRAFKVLKKLPKAFPLHFTEHIVWQKNLSREKSFSCIPSWS